MKEKTSRVEFECFCGEEFTEGEKHRIRYACNGLSLYKKLNGNSYCVLHYPKQDKIDDFNRIVEAKKEENNFNFEGAYFPDSFNLFTRDIESVANFSRTTFTSSSKFYGLNFHNEVTFFRSTFIGSVEFEKITFQKKVEFGCEFRGVVNFLEIEALGDVSFSGVQVLPKKKGENSQFSIKDSVFQKKTTFDNSRFQGKSYFDNTEFYDADFDETIFFEHSSFIKTKFHKITSFNATFKGVANFEEAIFKEYANFTKCEFDISANFESAVFEKNADFTKAKFGNPNVESVCEKGGYFKRTHFQGNAIFEDSVFENGNFSRAEFEKEVVFRPTTFNKDADFTDTYFKAKANFKNVVFTQKAIFQGTIFDEHLVFIGSNDNPVFQKDNSLDLTEVRITSPEKVSFHTVRLRPSWFLNVDTRKFSFTKILGEFSDEHPKSIKKELTAIKHIPNSTHLLKIVYRQLATNAEENNRFEESSIFRRMAFETEWIEKKEKFSNWSNEKISCSNIFCRFWGKLQSVPIDLIHLLYRWLSGYGESWFRAFCWLIFIWLFFAVFYTIFGTFGTEEKKDTISIWKSFGYSLQVMALQKPEPRPFDALTYLFYGFETIFAPVQAALLALAIRRKFMR